MGTAFRSALTAGLETPTSWNSSRRSRRCSSYYYPDADVVLANPNGKVIVADGRNHLELSTERFDIIVTDPPPPIESSGASVISSKEYYEAGRAHLRAGRRDDAVDAVRGPGGGLQGPHPDVRRRCSRT